MKRAAIDEIEGTMNSTNAGFYMEIHYLLQPNIALFSTVDSPILFVCAFLEKNMLLRRLR